MRPTRKANPGFTVPLQKIGEYVLPICYVVAIFFFFFFTLPLREFLATFKVLTSCAGMTTRQTSGNFLLISSLRSSKANKITMYWIPVSSFSLHVVFHEPVSMVDQGIRSLKAPDLLASEIQVPEAFGESSLTRVSKISLRGGSTRCQRLRSVSWPGRPC